MLSEEQLAALEALFPQTAPSPQAKAAKARSEPTLGLLLATEHDTQELLLSSLDTHLCCACAAAHMQHVQVLGGWTWTNFSFAVVGEEHMSNSSCSVIEQLHILHRGISLPWS